MSCLLYKTVVRRHPHSWQGWAGGTQHVPVLTLRAGCWCWRASADIQRTPKPGARQDWGGCSRSWIVRVVRSLSGLSPSITGTIPPLCDRTPGSQSVPQPCVLLYHKGNARRRAAGGGRDLCAPPVNVNLLTSRTGLSLRNS